MTKILGITIGTLLLTITGYSQPHWESIVLANSQWRYLVATSEPPSGWFEPTFDDSGWALGQGGFGYGDNDDNTVTPVANSVYLRIRFNLANKSIVEELLLDIDYDDAFVAYLNGAEVARSGNVTDNPARYNSHLTSTHEAVMYSGGTPERYPVRLTSLTQDENTLAVQIINESTNSSDMTGIVFLNGRINSSGIVFNAPPQWFKPPFEFTESNLPILKISTNGQSIPDEPKITATLGIINNSNGINRKDDPFSDYNGAIAIETRGSSSQNFEKKNYGFETRTPTGENNNVSLLGLPEENDWVLHGPYSDKSLMRNALTYYLGSKMGRWAPRTCFCELFINESYRGVYLLVEKIKRDKNRVDISKLEPNEVSGEDLTGGYILSIDRAEDHWVSPYKGVNGTDDIRINYIYPEFNEMPTQQKQYIRDYVTSFENALHGPNFTDPTHGYRAYIKTKSFVDYFIINELSRNVDAYRLSAFFVKDKGEKIAMGPLWDYNLAFGNADYYECQSTQGWVIPGIPFYDGYQPPFWWNRLRQDPYFNSELKKRWLELRAGALSKDNIFHFIDSTANLLSAAQVRNFTQFPVLGIYIWPNYFVGKTYAEEIDYMKRWIDQRLQWMDSQIDLLSIIDDEPMPDRYKTHAYPNPFADEVTISMVLYKKAVLTITVCNTQGVTLYRESHEFSEGEAFYTIPAGRFGRHHGLLIYEVRADGKLVSTGKIHRLPPR
jgi:hypothetical protein